jgi:glycosyltransferase involved in cell wall biosynthesis
LTDPIRPPAFSIIVPTYNSGSTLGRCLQSLVDQRYPALEIIVVDAMSTDSTPAVLEQFRDAISVLIREPDAGQSDAINKGMLRATGEFMGWLNADDVLLPGALDCVAGLVRADPALEVVIGACERIYADGEVFVKHVQEDVWRLIGQWNIIDQPSTFWSRALRERIGLLDLTFRFSFDWDWWCRMARAQAKVKVTKAVLSRYYFTPETKTSTAGSAQAPETFRIIRNYAPHGRTLAYVYVGLYYAFDLRGCFDSPPTCGRALHWLAEFTRRQLKKIYGEELINCYNLHYASLQQRGLKWW